MTTAGGDEPQKVIDAYFGDTAPYWRDIYAEEGLQGLVYRERMQTALGWIDDLGLAPGARVLEVGCGAGLATLELARRGFAVESTDSSAEMVAVASGKVAEAGLDERVTLGVADAHALPQAAASFEAVLALGVIPWLHSPDRAIREMARVLAPGGHAVISADNRARLNILVDPAENPLGVPLKYAWRGWKRLRGRPRGPISHLYTPGQVDHMLRAAGLEPRRRATIGFGPFTFVWRPLGGRLGLRIHLALRKASERGLPRLRRTGWHYLVSARRV